MDAAVETFDTEAVVQALDRVPLEGWLIALVLLVAGIAVVRVLMTLIKRTLGRLPIDRALSAFLTSCAQIALYVVLGTIIADQLGLPVTSLVALLSLFALAISLSIQNVLANVVGGVVILTAKPFTAGDYIETDKGQGEVESVDLMYTHLATPDGKLVLIPNRELSADRITNFSRHPQRRMDISVRVGYEHENARVTAALLIAPPYDGVYVDWLQAKYSYHNAEFTKYANAQTKFNNSYLSFQAAWIRTHRSNSTAGMRY